MQAAHTGMTYNVPCMNALVVYVGSQAILQLNNKTPVITHSAPMDVFHQVKRYPSLSYRYPSTSLGCWWSVSPDL